MDKGLLMLCDDVIIRAAIVAHSKRRTRFTPRAPPPPPPPLFGTKLTQWILLGELWIDRYSSFLYEKHLSVFLEIPLKNLWSHKIA